ncbi:alpha/beta-hydrolase [Gloeophyllum trabeum ATCC 11539]|uniref:Alpha/beta-hydrolase n=1 Tax=Gloeophyllum trabeum (strain ATCC 11539 / FP-39264 / Madison 617) TaxID=670483 RepID=S7Q106_GLOTA|nr:alpha/beta-hydrolase [Gloeophyllum trabeum ATCC 11539]EPQ53626.1 alpha/beta-hydrolase [Gloeophyllum trabeum ATCC 11539]
MGDLQIDSFVFDARPSYPLLVTAKRYLHPSFSPDPDALTLVFAHATGAHKECWEPVLKHLLSVNGKAKIREAWSVDCPNHGDAAVLNEELLQWGYEPIFSWESQYAKVLHRILNGLGKGVPVDFSSRRLVAIGHSMGAVSWLLTRTFYPPPRFVSLVLVEPMILGPSFTGGSVAEFLEGSTAKRRDVWASREEAYLALLPRYRYDRDAMASYVEHALRDLPTALYPDKQGVTLKCTKWQELACYRDYQSNKLAWRYIKDACADLPVHFINGAVHDTLPKELKEDTVVTATAGRYKSWQEVQGAGHLAPQMAPKGVAEAILNVLADPDFSHKMPVSGSRL